MDQYNMEEIDLLDLCRFLLKKIVVIGICMAVCLCIGFILGNRKAPAAKIPAYEDLSTSDQYYITAIERDREILQEQVDYFNNAYIMNIDPLNTATGNIEFIANTSYIPARAYIDSIMRSSELDELVQKIVGSEAPVRAWDLISVSYYTEENGDCIVYIKIKAADMNTVESIRKELDTRLQPIVGPSYSFNSFMQYDSDLLSTQNNFVSQMNTIQTRITNNEGKLASDALTYYNTVVKGQAPKTSQRHPLRYAALGAVLGAFLSCAYFALVYIFSDTVKTEKELEAFGLAKIAKIDLSKDETLDYAKAAMDKLVEKKAILTYQHDKGDIIDKLDDDKILKAKEIYQDDTVLKEDNDGIIILVEPGKTDRSFIKKTLDTCKLFGIKVIGALIC